MGSFIDSKATGWFGFISVTPFMRSSCTLVSVSACTVPAGKSLRGGYQAVSYADIQHAYVHIRICCPMTGQMCCRHPWRSGSFTSLPTNDVVDFISNIWGLNSRIPCGLHLMTHHVDCFPPQILHPAMFLFWQRYSMFVCTDFSTIVSLPNQFLILNYKYLVLLSHGTHSFSIVLSGDPTSVSWTLSKSFVPSSTPSSAIYS